MSTAGDKCQQADREAVHRWGGRSAAAAASDRQLDQEGESRASPLTPAKGRGTLSVYDTDGRVGKLPLSDRTAAEFRVRPTSVARTTSEQLCAALSGGGKARAQAAPEDSSCSTLAAALRPHCCTRRRPRTGCR